ncbi:MAG: LytR/AlgR family response regulator transcription factor, partial [Pseudolactococcus laudensis]
MKVFILEDEPVQQFRIEGLVIDYLKKKNYLNDGVFAFGRTRDLLEELEVSSQNNIYFLDIMIGNNEKAGLEIAEEIRKIDPIGQI